MPRIPDEVMECAIFLYPSEAAAKAGERVGGSGFIVGISSETQPEQSWLYAVTAGHVIREGASPVVRLNTASGDFDILSLDEKDWFHHPDGDDVAVAPLFPGSWENYKFKGIHVSLFLTPELLENMKIGPGDDVFMVGRFLNHEGRQRNMPTARFGTIAMMAGEPIEHPTRGIKQESYLVEMHSLPGYSGSPVFMMFLKGTPRYGFEGVATDTFGPYVLGLDWCHLLDLSPVVRKHDADSQVDDYVVKSNLGMAGVLPSWKIREVLDIDELKDLRRRIDGILAAGVAKKDVALDSRPEAPLTRESFEEVVRKGSRPRPEG